MARAGLFAELDGRDHQAKPSLLRGGVAGIFERKVFQRILQYPAYSFRYRGRLAVTLTLCPFADRSVGRAESVLIHL